MSGHVLLLLATFGCFFAFRLLQSQLLQASQSLHGWGFGDDRCGIRVPVACSSTAAGGRCMLPATAAGAAAVAAAATCSATAAAVAFAGDDATLPIACSAQAVG